MNSYSSESFQWIKTDFSTSVCIQVKKNKKTSQCTHERWPICHNTKHLVFQNSGPPPPTHTHNEYMLMKHSLSRFKPLCFACVDVSKCVYHEGTHRWTLSENNMDMSVSGFWCEKSNREKWSKWLRAKMSNRGGAWLKNREGRNPVWWMQSHKCWLFLYSAYCLTPQPWRQLASDLNSECKNPICQASVCMIVTLLPDTNTETDTMCSQEKTAAHLL